MREAVGNFWEYPADIRCITTNGIVKANGEAVMGAGIALEAKRKFPSLPYLLGMMLKSDEGNRPYFIPIGGQIIVTFPTKHHWRNRSDINLITKSASTIAAMRGLRDKTIVVPRPGCGNGGLRWEDVKPVLAPILDDRFTVISWRP